MDSNHFNILALLTDLCYALQPILNKELPIVMTNSLYIIVKNYYINISPGSLHFQLERARMLLFLCFQMTQVYLYEQDYSSRDDAYMMTNLLFKSLEASPVDRFQVWKNLLRLRVTWPDLLRVYQQDTEYQLYFVPSSLEELLQEDPSWREKPDSIHQFYDKARHIVDRITSAGPEFQRLPENHEPVFLQKDIATPWAEPYFSALLTTDKTIEVLNERHDEMPAYKTKNNIMYDAVIKGDDVVSRELHILQNRLLKIRILHNLFDEWLTGYIVPEIGEYRLPDPPTPLQTYYGPTTDSNNCYFNTVLVSMFMFPTTFLLQHLFLKRLVKTHFFDMSQDFCVDHIPNFKSSTLNPFRKETLVNASFQMSTEVGSIIQQVVQADYTDRIGAVHKLQELYQAFQTNNLQQINNIRNRLITFFISCRAMSNMPIIRIGDQGEPEGVVLFLENLLGLKVAYIEKTQYYYSNASQNPEPECEHVTPEPDIFQYQLRFPQSPSIHTPYTLQQLLLKDEVNRDPPMCKFKRYNYFIEFVTELRARYICFTIQRTLPRQENQRTISKQRNQRTISKQRNQRTISKQRNQRTISRKINGIEVDEEGFPVEHHLLKYKVIPNETLDKISPKLRLRAVVVYQPGHYVCYVLDPYADEWLYYDRNALRPVGNHEEMMRHNNYQVLEQAVMYFYGED